MSRATALFGILALLPAALNTSPASAAGRLAVPLCTGDGVARVVQLPLGPARIPGGESPGCCAKGCHSGGARKRLGCCELDPAQ
ncbi:MAG: hypothetical protein JSS36_01975 [Proteobacteria bacterium]|nr:hypothetical protein [Pseudomonadota bacterium]